MLYEKPLYRFDSVAAGGGTAGAGEVFSDTRRQIYYVENFNSESVSLERAYDDRNDAIFKATGLRLGNPMRPLNRIAGFGLGEDAATGAPGEMTPEAYQARLAALAAQFPQHAGAIRADRPVHLDAYERARKAERAAAHAWERSDKSALAWAAWLSGTVTGSLQDPVNLALAAVTGPFGKAGQGLKGLLWHGVKAGAANAAAEAAIQPQVQDWRRRAGLDYGVGLAALNVAAAGAIGFGLDVTVRGATRGVKRLARGGPLEKLEEAARAAPESDAFRRAAEGDEEALRAAAAATGADAADPAMRAGFSRLEAETAFPRPPDVDAGENYRKLSQAIGAELGRAPPPGDAVVAPKARPGPDFSDEARPRLGGEETVEGKPVAFREVNPRDVVADAATFQFKSDGDAAGVTQRLRGVKRWDPIAAGKAIVFERADGQLVIADGHQRLGLARRLQEDGQQARLHAYVFREADGWRPEDVRAYAALKNMKELSGSSVDMAKVMRERPDLIDDSLPLSDGKLREAMLLARLSDEAFAAVVAGRLPSSHAALIADSAAPPSRHAGLLDELARADVANVTQARFYLAQLMELPTTTEIQTTLFGEEAFTRSVFAERAKVLDASLRQLRSDRRIFGVLEREAAEIERGGNLLNREANAARAENAAQLAELIEKLATARGRVATLLNDAAASVARGLKPANAAKAFVGRIADILEREGINGLLKTADDAADAAPAGARLDDPAGPEAKAQADSFDAVTNLPAVRARAAVSPAAPRIETVEDFAAAVEALKEQVGYRPKQRGPRPDAEDAEIVSDEGLFALPSLLDPNAPIISGSKTDEIVKKTRALLADVQAITDVALQHANVRLEGAPREQAAAFQKALGELLDIVDDRLQRAYEFTGEIGTFWEEVWGRFAAIMRDLTRVQAEANNGAAKLLSRASILERMLPKASDEESALDAAELDAFVGRMKEISETKFENPYPKHFTAIDAYKMELGALQDSLRALAPKAKRLASTNFDKMDEAARLALSDEIDDVLSGLSEVSHLARLWSEAVSGRHDRFSEEIDDLLDGHVSPAIDRLEDARDAANERYQDLLDDLYDDTDNPVLFAIGRGDDEYGREGARRGAAGGDRQAEGRAKDDEKPGRQGVPEGTNRPAGAVAAPIPEGKVELIAIPGYAAAVRQLTPPSGGLLGERLYLVFPEGTKIPDDADALMRVGGSVGQMFVQERFPGRWQVDWVEAPGIGDRLYDAVEAHLGVNLHPSGELKPAGYKFWLKRSPDEVKFHQWSDGAKAFLSPRRVDEELLQVGEDIAYALSQGSVKHLARLRSFEAELRRLWDALPPEAKTPEAIEGMFALRRPFPGRIRAAPPTLSRAALSPRAAEAMVDIRADVERILTKALPPGWRHQLRDALTYRGMTIEGYADPVERIVFVSLAAFDPRAIALEEVGHALKASRVIPDADYSRLLDETRRLDIRAELQIDERYGELYRRRYGAQAEEFLDEEAVFQMAAHRIRGRRFGGSVDHILDRLIKFLRAVRDALGVRGFRTLQDIFQDIGEGGYNIGSRAPDPEMAARARAAQKLFARGADGGAGEPPPGGGRIRDLINQAAAHGEISRDDADALVARLAALEAHYREPSAAAEALQREIDAEALQRRRQAGLQERARASVERTLLDFRDARGQADPAKAMVALLENLGQHELPEGTMSVAQHFKAVFGLAMSDLDGLLDAVRRNFLTGRIRDRARMDNVVRELFGEGTGDEAAAALARAAAEVMERLRQRFNAAGGAIGRLEAWGLPQWHDAVALIRAGRERWIEAITPLLDPSRMRNHLTGDPLTAADLRQSLGWVYDEITSNGAHEREASMAVRGLGRIANRRGEHRFLVFRDADAWMRYQADFGAGGDALAVIVNHIRGMSEDIAAMEVFGPNPVAMLTYMKDFAAIQAERRAAGQASHFPAVTEVTGRRYTAQRGALWSRSDPRDYARRMSQRLDNMWGHYRGHFGPPPDSIGADLSGAMRNVNVFTKLGGAAVTALSDVFWQIAARQFAGLPAARVIGDMVDQVRQGGEQEARRAGLVADSYLHMLNEGAREARALSATGVTGLVADRVLALSMLNSLTRAGNHAMSRGIMAFLADNTHLPFGQLSPETQRLFRRYGLAGADWEALRLDEGGAPRRTDFLAPEAVRATDERLAERYLAMVIQEAQYATLTGTLRAKSLSLGGTKAGTIEGEFLRHAMQFKSFAINVAILQGERMIREFVYRGWTGGARYAAGAVIAVTLGGAIVEQLQQIRNGKDPRDMARPEFWFTALYRSGGLSIWGDFLYAEQSRFGGGVAQTLAGPTAATVTDFARATWGAARKSFLGEETNLGREATSILRRYTPGASLWYLRQIWDRVLMDELQRQVDPEADKVFRRKIQGARRDYDQGFWWAPGQPRPERSPDFEAAFGR